MAEWSWVIVGYVTAYGSLAGYYLTLRGRRARLDRQLGRQLGRQLDSRR